MAIKPTHRLLGLFAVVWSFTLIQSLLWLSGQDWQQSARQLLGNFWLVALVVSSVIALYDYRQARKVPKLHFERQTDDILSLHRWSTVRLKVSHQMTRPYRFSIKELTAPSLQLSEPSLQCRLQPNQHSTLNYQIRPGQRGDADIDGLELLLNSPLGLWQSVWRDGCHSRLKVYPDFQAINGYNLLATDNQTSQLGIKHHQRRGQGMEFHQLREYQRGDSSRQIDWKATARRQKMISREYQDERDQQIIILLDNGRRMRSEDQRLGHLDHSINAMALLSHIALKQGDAVGLMSFGLDQRWLPGQKGSAHINNILNHVYDLQPGLHATDYSGAAQKLLSLQRKRSLVVLLTNTRDEDIDDLLPAVKLIGKNHLIMLANIREPVIKQILDQPVQDMDDVYRYTGTIDYLNRRQKVARQLTEAGVFMVDALPQDLAINVCNRYLDIKRSGYL